MEEQITIRFLAGVNQQSINALISVIESRLSKGIKKIKILISSSGGSVFHGISAYNFLKGIPAEIETYNFGSVDSIATLIYCAGGKRYSVSNARFLIHGISWNSQGPVNFEEKRLKEINEGLRVDRENIAKIIAENCNKTQKQIEDVMFKGTTFNSEQAKQFGLVHEINDTILSEGEEVIGIG